MIITMAMYVREYLHNMFPHKGKGFILDLMSEAFCTFQVLKPIYIQQSLSVQSHLRSLAAESCMISRHLFPAAQVSVG